MQLERPVFFYTLKTRDFSQPFLDRATCLRTWSYFFDEGAGRTVDTQSDFKFRVLNKKSLSRDHIALVLMPDHLHLLTYQSESPFYGLLKSQDLSCCPWSRPHMLS